MARPSWLYSPARFVRRPSARRVDRDTCPEISYPDNQGRGGRNGVEAVLSVFVHSHRLDHGWGALKNAANRSLHTVRVGVNKGFPSRLSDLGPRNSRPARVL